MDLLDTFKLIYLWTLDVFKDSTVNSQYLFEGVFRGSTVNSQYLFEWTWITHIVDRTSNCRRFKDVFKGGGLLFVRITIHISDTFSGIHRFQMVSNRRFGWKVLIPAKLFESSEFTLQEKAIRKKFTEVFFENIMPKIFTFGWSELFKIWIFGIF